MTQNQAEVIRVASELMAKFDGHPNTLRPAGDPFRYSVRDLAITQAQIERQLHREDQTRAAVLFYGRVIDYLETLPR